MALAAATIVGAGLKAARPILTPVLLAALITLAVAPLLHGLRSRRVPDALAIATVLVTTLLAFVAMGALVGGSINAFVARLPQYEVQLRSGVADLAAWLTQQGVALSPELLSKMIDPGPVLALLARMLQGVANLLWMVVLILLVVGFMLLEVLGLRSKLQLAALGPKQFEELERATRLVTRYLGVKILTSAATGLLIGVLTASVGLELWVLWGLLAFILNFIPAIGSILAAIPAVALAALQLGMGPALLVTSGYLAINLSIGNGIEPRVMGTALGLSPLVVFFSLMLWGWLLGPIGALLSVPLTIIVRIYLASMPDLNWIAVLLGPPDQPHLLTEAPKTPRRD